jgi:hypothetical protein
MADVSVYDCARQVLGRVRDRLAGHDERMAGQAERPGTSQPSQQHQQGRASGLSMALTFLDEEISKLPKSNP